LKSVSLKYYIEYFLVRGLEFFFRLFPTVVVEWMGRRLGDLLWYIIPYRFDVAYQNLGVVFPEMDRGDKMRMMRRIYRHYGYVFATYYVMHRPSFRARIAAVDPDGSFDRGAGLDKGLGTLYCVFHFGHWEAFIAFLTMKGWPFTGIYKVQRNPLTNAYFIRHREQFGNSIRHISARAGMESYEEVLKENRMLGIAIDQNFRKRGVKVRFFGREFSAARGAALLHIRRGAPLYLSAFYLADGGFRYEQKQIEPPSGTGDIEADLAAVMQTLLTETETFIRRYPEQWLWFHRVWSDLYTETTKRTWREYFI